MLFTKTQIRLGETFYDFPSYVKQVREFPLEKLSFATRKRLRLLELVFGIQWNSAARVDLKLRNSKRGGYLIDGTTKTGRKVTYYRKETPSTAAGQTCLYYASGRRVRIPELFWFGTMPRLPVLQAVLGVKSITWEDHEKFRVVSELHKGCLIRKSLDAPQITTISITASSRVERGFLLQASWSSMSKTIYVSVPVSDYYHLFKFRLKKPFSACEKFYAYVCSFAELLDQDPFWALTKSFNSSLKPVLQEILTKALEYKASTRARVDLRLRSTVLVPLTTDLAFQAPIETVGNSVDGVQDWRLLVREPIREFLVKLLNGDKVEVKDPTNFIGLSVLNMTGTSQASLSLEEMKKLLIRDFADLILD